MTSAEPKRAERLVPGQWPREGLEWLDRCPICGSGERALLYEGLRDRIFFSAPGEWAFHECGACGVGYLDPRPTADTIGLAYASYFTHDPADRPAVEGMSTFRRWQRAVANGYRNWRYGTREEPASALGVPLVCLMPTTRALLDSELRHLPRARPGARVLDVGFGDGAFLRWATAAGYEAVGVDTDPLAVAAAKRRGLNVFCGTAALVRETPAAFDIVTLSHVIEHVHDPRALLADIRQLLTPGGLLWLDTPNMASVGHHIFGPAWFGLDPPRHLMLFHHRLLATLLKDAGFAILRRLSRFEVCGRTFAVSRRVAARSSTPLTEAPVPLSLRLRGLWASLRVRIQPDRSEFITLLAGRVR